MLVAVVSSGSAVCQSAAQPQTVRIWGEAKDPNGGLIEGAKIVFEGEGKSWELTTDSAGLYSVELPAGTYKAKAKVPYGMFFAVQRPSFRAQMGNPIKLDFVFETYARVMYGATVNGRYEEYELAEPQFEEEDGRGCGHCL